MVTKPVMSRGLRNTAIPRTSNKLQGVDGGMVQRRQVPSQLPPLVFCKRVICLR